MELRHYITFFAAVLILQLFISIFNRTLNWLFASKLTSKKRKILFINNYLIANFLILLTIFRIFPLFRLSAFLLAFLLFVSFVSLGCLLCHFILKPYIPLAKLHKILRITYPIALSGLLGISIYNAYTPTVIHYEITLDKPIKPMRIGMASDLHLGILFGRRQLDKLAELMTQNKVDIILMPGDIMDDNTEAYVTENMRPHLAKLTAPLGVYATLGNHDFFGHQQAIKQELELAGIDVLFDQTKVINNTFVLVGRNDDLLRTRPSAEQLLEKVDTRLPIILLDHRPTEIEKHAKLPIDIQVSGHAHKGQIFPANLVTNLLYPLDYGYEKIGKGHFFVTSGYGFWGIPMRLGSQSEIVIIDVK
ncbi:metallophosphoesterase [Pasteurella canis]|uniref:metallophosphoesterase n=1 Tax=Pasteurella canis TaxID=753 RepID=UPI0013295813|nr:metallophosphoesterase [Pasteurella canis]MXN88533.1 metallophosphoesterase [Pasteurella canis]